MRCEVCGRKIHGDPVRAMIEGAKLTVCDECSKHGNVIYDEPESERAAPTLRRPRPRLILQPGKPKEPIVDTSIELVEGFGEKVRQAREKLGLSHEDLGKKLNEKVSQLRKIETMKMVPDNLLATKLERILRIKLIVPASEEKVPQTKIPRTETTELTLGDLLPQNDNAEKKGELKERKQS